MPESSVQDVLAVRSYKGDSLAGGSQSYGIEISATPFEKIAAYTYEESKLKWQEKNKQDKEFAEQQAKMMALDVNTTNKELYEALDKQKKEMLAIMDEGDCFDYRTNPDCYKRLHQKYNEFTANRTKASAFDLLKNAEEKRIAALPAEQQASARETLQINERQKLSGGADSFFKFSSQLETGAQFTADAFALPTVGKVEYKTFTPGGNIDIKVKTKVIDIEGLQAASKITWLGLEKDKFTPIDNPNKDPKIADENRKMELQFSAKNKESLQYRGETLKKTNEIITLYLKEKQDYEAADPEARKLMKVPQPPEIVSAIGMINDEIKIVAAELNKQHRRGQRPTVPKVNTINLEDGLSGDELIVVNTLAQMKEKGQSFIEYEDDGVRHNTATQTSEAAKNRAANAPSGKKPGEGYNDGNDFDKIDDTPGDAVYIQGGVVYNKNKSLHTGEIIVPVNNLPVSIRNTVEQFGGGKDDPDNKADYLMVTDKKTGKQGVSVYVQDGVPQRIKTTKGTLTRENQLAGQRNFDKRVKEEKQNAFGDGGSGLINRTYE